MEEIIKARIIRINDLMTIEGISYRTAQTRYKTIREELGKKNKKAILTIDEVAYFYETKPEFIEAKLTGKPLRTDQSKS